LIPDWNVYQFSTIEQIRWLTKKSDQSGWYRLVSVLPVSNGYSFRILLQEYLQTYFSKARISESNTSLHVSLSLMESYTSIGKSKFMIERSSSSPSINLYKKCPSWSESIASISSALSAPRNCLGLSLSSQILYRNALISEVLNP
jgi:hypothetical protein